MTSSTVVLLLLLLLPSITLDTCAARGRDINCALECTSHTRQVSSLVCKTPRRDTPSEFLLDPG